jgi:DNA-3-methyladenine glycosylase II
MKFQLKQDDLINYLKELSIKRKEIRIALKETGYPKCRRNPINFESLAHIVIGQQVSTNAASSISAKLKKLCGAKLDANNFITTPTASLTAVGLSKQKRRYLKELAEKTITGELSINGLRKLSDSQVLDKITSITGFGPWSAQMFLIFSLGRVDIWPAGDLGVRSGIGKICGLSDRPSQKETIELGEPYKPYRSSVALLSWHYVNSQP